MEVNLRGRTGSKYRFTALRERGGNASTEPGIETFSLGFDGCWVEHDEHPVMTQEGPSITMDLQGAEQQKDGWYIKTRADQDPMQEQQDPARYKIESFHSNTGWTAVGGSSWYYA